LLKKSKNKIRRSGSFFARSADCSIEEKGIPS